MPVKFHFGIQKAILDVVAIAEKGKKYYFIEKISAGKDKKVIPILKKWTWQTKGEEFIQGADNGAR